MENKKKLPALLFFLVSLSLFSIKPIAAENLLSDSNRELLRSLIESDSRSDKLQARNKFRHPLETLDFFEVTPDLTVVEIWPGGQGGWYRSILEPYIAGKGTYIPVRENKRSSPPIDEVADGTADRVLVFRAHAFMIYGHPASDYFAEIFKMLKPGGVFGIVDHRGNEAVPQDPQGENGYVNQSHVLMLAKNAGFELVAQSEVNANALDSKDYPNGVYSLPPTLRGSTLRRTFRAQMLEIGESDRMTLKFRKPE